MERRPSSLAWLVLGVAALASAQGVRESVRVGFVTVRLDVRGRDGRPLQDLTASEVKLLVDGKGVAIEGLDRVGAAASAAGPSAPQGAPSLAPPEPAGAPTASAASSSELYGDPRR